MLGALVLIPALSHFLLQGESRKAQKAAADYSHNNNSAIAGGTI